MRGRRDVLLLGCWLAAVGARRDTGMRAMEGGVGELEIELDGLAAASAAVGEEAAEEDATQLARLQGDEDTTLMEDLMKTHFPQLQMLMTRKDFGCSGKYTKQNGPYPQTYQTRSTKTKGKEWRMMLLWPGCFKQMRQRMELDADFIKDIQNVESVKRDSEGAQPHFVSKDKERRFYLKGVSRLQLSLLEDDKFIFEFVEYFSKHPNTLMVPVLAVVRFQSVRRNHYLVVMENFKRGVDAGKDSFAEFDLKASMWRHRSKRCTPMFPLDFWKAGEPHQFKGHDLDFYALRTQVSEKYLQKVDRDLDIELLPFKKGLLEAEKENLPAHDSCLGGDDAREWIKQKKKLQEKLKEKRPELELGDYEFCKELGSRVQELQAVTKDSEVYIVNRRNASELATAFKSVQGPTCKAFLNQKQLKDDNVEKWSAFVRQEKVAIDVVREYFGYPTPSDRLSQKPIVVEPCMRQAFLKQLDKDTEFLANHKMNEYSMDLVIKYHKADPKTVCEVEQAVAQKDQLDFGDTRGFQGRSIFERLEGGMRSMNASRSEQAESAVFMFKIVDTLSKTSGKTLNEEPVSLLPMLWNELLQEPRSTVEEGPLGQLEKCKDLKKENVTADSRVMCWSGCSKAPKCDFEDKLQKSESKAVWNPLAEYDFQGDWVKDHTEKLTCKGWRNRNNHGRRVLCAVTRRSPFDKEDIKELSFPDASGGSKIPSLSEPFRSEWDDRTISSIVEADEVKKVLNNHLELKVDNLAPMVLKRVAAMAYYDFSRRPWGKDEIPAKDYAERFMRFFSAWVESPHGQEWSKMCPHAKEAGCKHVGGAAWVPEDSELYQPEQEEVFVPYDTPYLPGAGRRGATAGVAATTALAASALHVLSLAPA